MGGLLRLIIIAFALDASEKTGDDVLRLSMFLCTNITNVHRSSWLC